jgi:hypothetical protein
MGDSESVISSIPREDVCSKRPKAIDHRPVKTGISKYSFCEDNRNTYSTLSISLFPDENHELTLQLPQSDCLFLSPAPMEKHLCSRFSIGFRAAGTFTMAHASLV